MPNSNTSYVPNDVLNLATCFAMDAHSICSSTSSLCRTVSSRQLIFLFSIGLSRYTLGKFRVMAGGGWVKFVTALECDWNAHSICTLSLEIPISGSRIPGLGGSNPEIYNIGIENLVHFYVIIAVSTLKYMYICKGVRTVSTASIFMPVTSRMFPQLLFAICDQLYRLW
jgi:hypothetical protein